MPNLITGLRECWGPNQSRTTSWTQETFPDRCRPSSWPTRCGWVKAIYYVCGLVCMINPCHSISLTKPVLSITWKQFQVVVSRKIISLLRMALWTIQQYLKASLPDLLPEIWHLIGTHHFRLTILVSRKWTTQTCRLTTKNTSTALCGGSDDAKWVLLCFYWPRGGRARSETRPPVALGYFPELSAFAVIQARTWAPPWGLSYACQCSCLSGWRKSNFPGLSGWQRLDYSLRTQETVPDRCRPNFMADPGT